MNYSDARPHIKNFEVIGFCHADDTIFGRFIKYVQSQSKYGYQCKKYAEITHIGLAFWENDRLYVMHEAGISNVIAPLSQFKDEKLYIFKNEMMYDRDCVFSLLMDNKIKYGWLDNWRILVRFLTGFGAKKETVHDFVCSTFASEALKNCGFVFPLDFPAMPSPSELCSVLELRLIINE